MKLTELEPHWLSILDERTTKDVVSIADADGIRLLCPSCWQDNNGPVGTHSVICWRPRVGAERSPGPGRWEFKGTGFTDLTLVGAEHSSIQLLGGCNAHFFIRNGEIIPC